jgi:hypothetical protein
MRMDFKTFLVEGKSVQQTTEQRTHSEHVNHLPFDGHEAMAQVHDTMTRMHNYLLGRKNVVPKLVSTKIDGAPAIHFLKDENGRIGIGTKGVFNKNPKIAWTHEDVTKHYGHAPGLEEIMHTMLDHGHKILPADMKPGEMYKGDVLKKAGRSDGHSVLHSNLLRYKFPRGSSEADQIDNSKVGIALHTHYDRKGRASAITPQQRSKFRSHPDVFNLNPDVQVNPENYTPEEQQEFNTHMENARTEYQRLKPEAYDAVGHHNMDMRAYANDVVRRGTNEPLTTQGYVDFLTQKHKKDLEKYKTQGTVDKKSQAHSEKVNEIMRNKEHFDKLFKIHDHVQKAKNVLVGVMNKNAPSHVELPNGQPTNHEGYMTDGGIKLVNQDDFTRNNSAYGMVQQAKQNVKESINEDIKMPVKKNVTFIGRTQPPHGGHLHAVEGAMDHANKIGASHTILLTHTHNKDNPLTPEQKLKYAQKSFPGANIQMTSPESPSLLHHASKLYADGVRDFTVFAGPERLPSYDKLLNSYNGVKGPHGYYKFDNMDFKSSGDRDPDAEGIEGASGTDMKKAALAGDAETFNAMASPHMSPADKTRMMKDVQAGLAKFAKVKKLKEETTSAGDAVRGFGDVSGNPAVDLDPLQQYITTNELAKDKQNGALLKMMRQTQSGLLGFKEFNPMSRSGAIEYFDDDDNHNPLLRDKVRNSGKKNNVTRG